MINLKKADDLLLKVHGMFATIEANDMNDLFHQRLGESGLDYEQFEEAYVEVSSHISEGYEENKQESDKAFVEEVIESMKKIVKYAKAIKGYQEMGTINKEISQEDFHLETEGEKFNEMGTEKGESQAN
ncbi:hypothetical protein AB3N02_21840 [Priestia aryabhattai]|uniref:hypothetical protein n=1 Tax=Priestia aryabhattai TaxID=412384 RepID=UPI0039A134BC